MCGFSDGFDGDEKPAITSFLTTRYAPSLIFRPLRRAATAVRTVNPHTSVRCSSKQCVRHCNYCKLPHAQVGMGYVHLPFTGRATAQGTQSRHARTRLMPCKCAISGVGLASRPASLQELYAVAERGWDSSVACGGSSWAPKRLGTSPTTSTTSTTSTVLTVLPALRAV